MSNSVVQGKLGCGKGKYVVGKMRAHLRKGLRVATNCDLFLEKLMPQGSKATALRVPDKPTPKDLDDIGFGCADEDKYDEDKYGIMVLDELGAWLNARAHAGADRQPFINWMIHARKKRWHVYFIAQDLSMIDAQVRNSLIEYVVKLVRADKMRIPVVGPLLGKFGSLKGVHVAKTMLMEIPGFVVDTDWFKGKDLQDGYDTLQIFRDWNRAPTHPDFKDEVYVGPFSYLSAWHLKGRHQPPTLPRTFMERLKDTPARVASVPKPKPRALELAARLPAHEAMRYTKLYLQAMERAAA